MQFSLEIQVPMQSRKFSWPGSTSAVVLVDNNIVVEAIPTGATETTTSLSAVVPKLRGRNFECK